MDNIIKLLSNNSISVEITKGDIPPGMLDDVPFHGETTISQ